VGYNSRNVRSTRERQADAGKPPLLSFLSSRLTLRFQAITRQLEASNIPIPYIQILLSELSPAKLALFNPHISTFIQTSCPRLSIDWGYAFQKPLLSPYETAVAVGQTNSWRDNKIAGGDDSSAPLGYYPMDFYSAGSPWAVSRAKGEF
jgi:2-(3-amino-3-carboxypropyl)histidine synthase